MARPLPTSALDALKPEPRRFIAEYLATGKGAHFALVDRYSAGADRQTAARLLTRADIQTALRESQQEIVDKLRITAAGGELLNQIDTHAPQSTAIVQTYAGEWLSKKNYERARQITHEDAQGFIAIALRKLRSELKQEGERS